MHPTKAFSGDGWGAARIPQSRSSLATWAILQAVRPALPGVAIRFVRSHAQPYVLNANRVGLIGFSAGAMAAVEVALATDPAARPDFAAIMYGAALTQQGPSAGAPPRT